MLSLAHVAPFGLPSVRSLAEVISMLETVAAYTDNYPGYDVVVDGDTQAYRATLDYQNKLIIIHGGTLQVIAEEMAQQGWIDAFVEQKPSAAVAARIAAARTRFPLVKTATLGTAAAVNAKALSLLAQLKSAPTAAKTSWRAAAAVGVIALALATIAGTAYLSRHHDI